MSAYRTLYRLDDVLAVYTRTKSLGLYAEWFAVGAGAVRSVARYEYGAEMYPPGRMACSRTWRPGARSTRWTRGSRPPTPRRC